MKTYQLHETEYRRMRERGTASWGERNSSWAVDPQNVSFLEELLRQGWFPARRRIIEVGCGTGPVLRWFADRSFEGLGIDISDTAIQMAREQSEGYNLSFCVADICGIETDSMGSFDLCVDAGAFHCLTDPYDRRQALARIHALLQPNGVFVLMGMCAPVDRKNFSLIYEDQRIVNGISYAPSSDSAGIAGALRIEGRDFIPTRAVKRWRELLTELRRAGFRPTLLRVNVSTPLVPEEPVSGLLVAALRDLPARTD